MRLVWLSEQKRWEDEQASLADDLAMEESDDDRDMQKKRQPLPNGPFISHKICPALTLSNSFRNGRGYCANRGRGFASSCRNAPE